MRILAVIFVKYYTSPWASRKLRLLNENPLSRILAVTWSNNYTKPWATMAFATLTKPAMLAPAT